MVVDVDHALRSGLALGSLVCVLLWTLWHISSITGWSCSTVASMRPVQTVPCSGLAGAASAERDSRVRKVVPVTGEIMVLSGIGVQRRRSIGWESEG